MFPEKLLEVLKYLNEIKIQIAEDHEDGRVNSIADESTLIKLLVDKYGEENIEEPPASGIHLTSNPLDMMLLITFLLNLLFSGHSLS